MAGGIGDELSEHDARQEARRRFGAALRFREQSADIWRWRWLDDLGRDLQHGTRHLRTAPRFTIVAMSLLTVGAGVALSVVHVANAARFHMFSVADADQLVRVARQSPEITSLFPSVPATFYREHATLFSYLISESVGPRVSVGALWNAPGWGHDGRRDRTAPHADRGAAA